MTNTNEIRLVRAPKLKLFAPAHIVDGFEIKWDTRIQAWEMAKRPKPTGMWEFRIGRVVNGAILITEMVADTKLAKDRLSVEAAHAFAELENRGVDLGEWAQDSTSLAPNETPADMASGREA